MDLLYYKVILLLCLIATASCSRCDNDDRDNSWGFWDFAAIGVGAVGAVVVAPLAVPAILTGVGFTSAGVLEGSTAAAVQSCYGGYVAAGSLFAAAQSIGAAGTIGYGTMATAGVVGAGVGYATKEVVDGD